MYLGMDVPVNATIVKSPELKGRTLFESCLYLLSVTNYRLIRLL
jgi:hypothetical protein